MSVSLLLHDWKLLVFVYEMIKTEYYEGKARLQNKTVLCDTKIIAGYLDNLTAPLSKENID